MSTLDQLQNKLKAAVTFPSPPAVAQQIIDLASDPEIDIAKVAAVVTKDPGLTAKILRVANSSLYCKRRKSENLRQATVVLGLNAVTTLALSFSLVSTYNRLKGTGIDYNRYWRRAILGASAARTMATILGVTNAEDIFLAALLQDIAVLAIDRVETDFYKELPRTASTQELIAHEHERLQADHAKVGAWLLTHWKLPPLLCRTVEFSHAPQSTDAGTPVGVATRCLALAEECVDMLLAGETPKDMQPLADHAQAWLGFGADTLTEAIGRIVAEIPDVERLFDTSLLAADTAAAILETSRELLTIRNLQALEQVNSLQAATRDLAARTEALEDRHRHDALTGVFSRGHLDHFLEQEFNAARSGNWPLSVVFVDLDRFKLINDTYGHPAGDAVLSATAQLLLSGARAGDCVARYGGEEFMLVLPGLGDEDAEAVCERLLANLRAARHRVADTLLRVTASLGLATHCAHAPFKNVSQLVEAADRAVYLAKKAGRDRMVRHTPEQPHFWNRHAGAADHG